LKAPAANANVTIREGSLSALDAGNDAEAERSNLPKET
jgi:hypothetical protein